MRPWLRRAASLLVPLYIALFFAAPCVCLAQATRTPSEYAWAWVAVAPLAFLATAGLLSLPHQPYVVAGRMPVDLAYPAYFHRRMYGLCWTAVFYSGPIYHAVLSIPWLRRITFRSFGYRGSMDFTVYPDTWLRDLPLLDFGAGCYLSNKATLGSNMIFFRNGGKWIEVGSIQVGKGAMVGHMSVVGPGTSIGDHAIVGVVASVGRRVTIGAGAVVGDGANLDHGAFLEPEAAVKACCYVGMGRTVMAGESMQVCEVLQRKPQVSTRLKIG